MEEEEESYRKDGITVEAEEGELQQKIDDGNGDTQMNGNLAAGDTSNNVPPSEEQKGSTALGQSDSGELSRTTGIEEPKGAKETGLLTAGFAAALSGHWDIAEKQFEETAKRVRDTYYIHVYFARQVLDGDPLQLLMN